MTDPEKTQPNLAHPLPDGVSDTFVRPCLDCGNTVQVLGGVEQDHHCAAPRDPRELIAQAWWAGHDAGHEDREGRVARLTVELAEAEARIERWRRSNAGLVIRARGQRNRALQVEVDELLARLSEAQR
jgi:hypothetical protein